MKLFYSRLSDFLLPPAVKATDVPSISSDHAPVLFYHLSISDVHIKRRRQGERYIQTLSNFSNWTLIALSIIYDFFIKTKKSQREKPEQSYVAWSRGIKTSWRRSKSNVWFGILSLVVPTISLFISLASFAFAGLRKKFFQMAWRRNSKACDRVEIFIIVIRSKKKEEVWRAKFSHSRNSEIIWHNLLLSVSKSFWYEKIRNLLFCLSIRS